LSISVFSHAADAWQFGAPVGIQIQVIKGAARGLFGALQDVGEGIEPGNFRAGSRPLHCTMSAGMAWVGLDSGFERSMPAGVLTWYFRSYMELNGVSFTFMSLFFVFTRIHLMA